MLDDVKYFSYSNTEGYQVLKNRLIDKSFIRSSTLSSGISKILNIAKPSGKYFNVIKNPFSYQRV